MLWVSGIVVYLAIGALVVAVWCKHDPDMFRDDADAGIGVGGWPLLVAAGGLHLLGKCVRHVLNKLAKEDR